MPRQIGGKRVASPEYRSWQMMKNRCLNPRATDYAYYGERGITICSEWMEFREFFKDMGPKPTKLHTLERRDNDKNYCKENCLWATRKQQARNRNFLKKYRGKFVWEIAAELGIKPSTFHCRLWQHKTGLISEKKLYAIGGSGRKRIRPRIPGF